MFRTKVFIVFFFFSACLKINAQNRMKEMINLAYAWNPEGHFSAYDAKLGLEYFKTSQLEASAVFSLREADLEMNKFLRDDRHLKNYKLSLPLVYRRPSGWMYIFSPSVSNRNASHSFLLDDQTLYYSAIGLASFRAPGPSTRWVWSFGFLYSREIEDHFYLPIVSAMYTREAIRLQLGFPNFGIFYQPTKGWELGIRANFDSTTYTLSRSDSLANGGASPGLKVRILDIGPVFNVRLSDHIWLNTNVGVVALAEAQTVSARGSSKDLVYKGDNSLFLRASLSYYPFLN